ncbi:inactive protein RESTRICTED TEV MOVEMENT 2-like [Lotus japonicus]|uniref:inactive protein RESTRICTED TEV MOVEMENT 2-like n=1 Tax=Lotus japonicus TaxID=34305 RepID=UPI00258EECA1|nr:inactive protein RESTRICTED TEV MOVEMENT 2-like [Lotus japonicus]
MALRPRTPTFRPQLSVRRVYETFQPRSEIKETPKTYLLHVYLPGFTKDHIKITFTGSSQMVRITGERQFGGNRWIRFDQTYPIPENGDAETLEGKFVLGTLILTIQKKLNSQVEPKQEVETTQEKGPVGPPAVAESKPKEEAQEISPPQSRTTKVEPKPEAGKVQEKSSAGPPEKIVGEAKLEKEAQETIPPQSTTTTKVEEPSPVKVPANFKDQKNNQDDTSPQIPSEPMRDHSAQKGQEEIDTKPTPTKETTIQTDEKHPKGPLEEVEPKPTLLTTFARDLVEAKSVDKVKEQLEEKKEGMSAKNMEKGDIKENEIQTRKFSSKKKDETSASKFSEKEKESSSRTSPKQQGKNYGEDIIYTIGNGIRNLASSSSDVVTRITERKLNDEDKHLVANIGVAVLVIAAWGAYATYKCAS